MRKCLLLEDADKRLRALEPALEAVGFRVLYPVGDVERLCAKEADNGLSLVGAGEGALRALLLAERYPVGKVALIGCPLRPRNASRLRRRAEHNLFSVVSDLLVVQPAEDPSMRARGVDILLRGVSARVTRRVEMGRDFQDLWTNCKQPLTEAVLDFLTGPPEAKTLAKPRNS
ncbi:MAG: hypothetical protein GX592_02020 [Clostridiales bacterium]|nr:hypothetical protein [Clostridiales bacterium]